MGGLLFKNTRRYLKDEYMRVSEKILRNITNLTDGFGGNGAIIPSVFSKESYGDVDILVEVLPGENPRAILHRFFKPENIHHNGNTYSFVFEELQCDIIITQPEDYYFHLDFLSWSNFGMLAGVISRSLGMRYTHQGLYYLVRDGAQKHGDLLITKKSKMAFELLGLDYARFKIGFDTDKELFDYIIGSKYFSPPQFDLLNLNHHRRARNAKRPGWAAFLEYIKDMPQDFNKEGYIAGKENALEHLEINGFKAHGAEIIQNARDYSAAKKQLVSVFAADFPLVREKSLGEHIVKFKSLFPDNKQFVDFLLNSDNMSISNKIKEIT